MHAHKGTRLGQSAFCPHCSARWQVPVCPQFSSQKRLYDMQLQRKQQVLALQQQAHKSQEEYWSLTPEEQIYYNAYHHVPLANMPQREPMPPELTGHTAPHSYACRACDSDYANATFQQMMDRMKQRGLDVIVQIKCMQWFEVFFEKFSPSIESADISPNTIQKGRDILQAVVSTLQTHQHNTRVVEEAIYLLEMVCCIFEDVDEDWQVCTRITWEGTSVILSILHQLNYSKCTTCERGLTILRILTANHTHNNPRRRVHPELLSGVTEMMQHNTKDIKYLLVAGKILRCMYGADDSKETMLYIEANALPVLEAFCAQNKDAHEGEIYQLTREMTKTAVFRRTHRARRYKTFDN